MSESLININPADLQDPKDSIIIKEDTEGTVSTNIYELAKFVDSLKAKYIDIPEDTLTMGIFGYISN